MAGVNVRDLPASVRARIEADHPPGGSKRRKPSRTTPDVPHAEGRCGAPGCDWTGRDRHDQPKDCRKNGPCDCFLAHMIATGHHRFDIPLPKGDPLPP